jgi:hypothetical protein
MPTFIIDQVSWEKGLKMDARLYSVKVLTMCFTGIERVLSSHLLWGPHSGFTLCTEGFFFLAFFKWKDSTSCLCKSDKLQ